METAIQNLNKVLESRDYMISCILNNSHLKTNKQYDDEEIKLSNSPYKTIVSKYNKIAKNEYQLEE